MTSQDGPAHAADGALAERLTTERNVWLCTVRPDGSPHVVPIWFVWHDEAFWCVTSSGSVKVRNLGADPRAAVALEDGDRPVVAEGRVRLHERPYPPALVQRFEDAFGWDIRVSGEDGDWATMLELRPERWLLGGPDG